ncbi:hypothetical protein FRC03_001735 [Tulasnella sp. 419]|nr:hypothetical protein FRC02_009233 [Tulasnella sp. 418]KAG8964484.1 hypothetical protein FRC03_001735 [Tulasnella sp. 419]
MCSQVAEGVHHRGCSHFVVNFFPVAIKDCEQPDCAKSRKHPASCYSPHCKQSWGNVIEKCSAISYEKCDRCQAKAMPVGGALRR